MKTRATKLTAFGLSIGQSLLGLVALFALARFEGSSSAMALSMQVSALAAITVTILGIEAGRQHMVHMRLNRSAEEAQPVIQNLFSVLLVGRSLLSGLLIFGTPTLIAFLTNINASSVEADLTVVRLLGFELAAQVLLDVALFVGISKGWLLSGPATAFGIYLLRVVGLFAMQGQALEYSIAGMIAGDLLGAGYILLRLFRREDARFLKPTFNPKRWIAGMRLALPTSILGFFAGFVIWSRNYALSEYVGEGAVSNFGYINSLLMVTGLVFATTLLTSEGVKVSDKDAPLEERKAMVTQGFYAGLTWALGSMVIVSALAPWIIRVAFGLKAGAMTDQDIAMLTTALTWMSPLIGGATLAAFAVRVAMAFSLRRRFFMQNAAVLLVGVMALFFFYDGENKIAAFALIPSLVAFTASTIFFLSLGEFSRQEFLEKMKRPALGLLALAAMVFALRFFELDQLTKGESILDAASLAASGLVLLGSYLVICWGRSLRR